MITANAVISNIIVENNTVLIQFSVEGKYFPTNYSFNTSSLGDITKLMFLLQRTKAKNINDLIGKRIQVIDTEEISNSLVAVGDQNKNKFVDLYGGEFPVRERKIYKKYQ